MLTSCFTWRTSYTCSHAFRPTGLHASLLSTTGSSTGIGSPAAPLAAPPQAAAPPATPPQAAPPATPPQAAPPGSTARQHRQACLPKSTRPETIVWYAQAQTTAGRARLRSCWLGSFVGLIGLGISVLSFCFVGFYCVFHVLVFSVFYVYDMSYCCCNSSDWED